MTGALGQFANDWEFTDIHQKPPKPFYFLLGQICGTCENPIPHYSLHQTDSVEAGAVRRRATGEGEIVGET